MQWQDWEKQASYSSPVAATVQAARPAGAVNLVEGLALLFAHGAFEFGVPRAQRAAQAAECDAKVVQGLRLGRIGQALRSVASLGEQAERNAPRGLFGRTQKNVFGEFHVLSEARDREDGF